jgi:hypothetical protein
MSPVGPRAKALKARHRAQAREAKVYVRFVCFKKLDGQRFRLGLFQSIWLAEDAECRPDWAVSLIEETRRWFNDNLEAPTLFEHSQWQAHSDRALCWFKASAQEHIRRMFDLKHGLEACGLQVDVLRSRRPGAVRYQDEFQVAAEPVGRVP